LYITPIDQDFVNPFLSFLTIKAVFANLLFWQWVLTSC